MLFNRRSYDPNLLAQLSNRVDMELGAELTGRLKEAIPVHTSPAAILNALAMVLAETCEDHPNPEALQATFVEHATGLRAALRANRRHSR